MNLDNEEGEAPDLVQEHSPQTNNQAKDTTRKSLSEDAREAKVPITIITGNLLTLFLSRHNSPKPCVIGNNAYKHGLKWMQKKAPVAFNGARGDFSSLKRWVGNRVSGSREDYAAQFYT